MVEPAAVVVAVEGAQAAAVAARPPHPKPVQPLRQEARLRLRLEEAAGEVAVVEHRAAEVEDAAVERLRAQRVRLELAADAALALALIVRMDSSNTRLRMISGPTEPRRTALAGCLLWDRRGLSSQPMT